MAIKPRDAIALFKAAPALQKAILAIAAADVLVLVLASATFEDQVDARVGQVEQLQGDLKQLRAKLETTRRQIGNLPELRQKYDSASTSGVLNEQDRQKLVSLAQDLTAQHRLLDLHYKLEPQESAPPSPSGYAVVTTPVTFDNSGMLDSDILGFWNDMLRSLPSHYQIAHATIERVETPTDAVLEAIRGGHPPEIVKSELGFRWISMHKVTANQASKPAAAANGAGAPQASAAARPVKAADAAQNQ